MVCKAGSLDDLKHIQPFPVIGNMHMHGIVLPGLCGGKPYPPEGGIEVDKEVKV